MTKKETLKKKAVQAKAGLAFRRALSRAGFRAKDYPCRLCGNPAALFHHPMASKTTQVIPVCRKCHFTCHFLFGFYSPVFSLGFPINLCPPAPRPHGARGPR